ncbi:MAG TPA: ABC-type transport auxiliary lipoprotein family protein [Alphaproteobacteria bacterium]|nr:ABC-type transport auxiliary lipoprotein family protein [Alphaproteobacteria bacterium]
MSDHLHLPISRRGVLAGFVAFPTVFALDGCIGAQHPPEPRRFYLMPLNAVSSDLPKVDWSLAVDPPETLPALNTKRVVLAFSENEFDYYADVEWGDEAPVMVQQIIIRSFQKLGKIDVVVSERERVRGDFRLTSFLSPFFAVGPKGGAPEVRIGLNAQLIRARGRQTVGTRAINQVVQSSDASIVSIVGAFNTAMHQVLEELVSWTLKAGVAATV